MTAVWTHFDYRPLEDYIVVNFPDPHSHMTTLPEQCRISDGWVAQLLGCSRMTVFRMRKRGKIARHRADIYACKLNIHPSWLWPNWIEHVELEEEDDLVCA